jgi:hypothetical protein
MLTKIGNTTMTEPADVNKILASVILSATEATIKSVANPAQSAVRRALQSISNAYSPYLETTFRRVRTIRTFLKPNEAIDLIENYVSVELCDDEDNKNIDTDYLLERLLQGERFVISGIAGRGKSVLMRYIALCLYHTPRGKIPLFLELRALNQLSSKDILSYIHSQYQGNSSIQFGDFQRALQRGYFVFIIDGFDEIDPNSRQEIESQILNISRTYRECSLIVSGRPDDRFYSWDEFTVYSVAPMTLAKTRMLIERADYDLDVKKLFLKRLTQDFFHRHESFLSTPLLAIMLMLTFEEYAEIPVSLHEFYRNAFDTLVRRHDAMKAQFLRVMHSGCSAAQFRTLFASFCLLTYSKSAYQFSHDQAIESLDKAATQQGISANRDALLADLIESLCLLQREGFEITFVHRSFQEYFCALFVAQSKADLLKKYLDSGRFRVWDSVLTMLYGMAPERVEAEWANAVVSSLIKEFPTLGEASVMNFVLALFPKIMVSYVDDDGIIVHTAEQSEVSRQLSILNRFYPAHFHERASDKSRGQSTRDMASRSASLSIVLQKCEAEGDARFKGLTKRLQETAKTGDWDDRQIISIELEESDIELARETGLFGYAQTSIRALKAISKDQAIRSREGDKFLDLVFGQ